MEACAAQPKPDSGLFSEIGMDWGGHLRAIGTAAFMDGDSIYQFDDTQDNPYDDGQTELRLKNSLYLGSRWTIQTHYELAVVGGDTRESNRELAKRFPALPEGYAWFSQTPSDSRRLFNLTRLLAEEDSYLAYHRLDRLNVTVTPDWGTLRLGRQALTWGDGLVFNPMDLFNPFAPTSVQRDYKTGDDMAHLALQIGESDLQILYLPRRDPHTGDLEEKMASYALKYHTPVGAMEANLMVARHYDDSIAGLGASGYLGEAAWRVNAIYTRLSGSHDADGFFQVVANLDYAWTWGGKNVYGLIEYYYNGLGENGSYDRVFSNQALAERLSRGELYTIGRQYLAGRLQIELHPLVQLHATAITNLQDPSGLLQPQLAWDVTENLQAILGGQWHWGGHGSEFGGYETAMAGPSFTLAPADQLYIWLTYHF